MMAVVSSVAAVGTGFPQQAMGSDMGDVRKATLETLDVRGSNRIGGERSKGGFTWFCISDHGFGWDCGVEPSSDFFVGTGVTVKKGVREEVTGV